MTNVALLEKPNSNSFRELVAGHNLDRLLAEQLKTQGSEAHNHEPITTLNYVQAIFSKIDIEIFKAMKRGGHSLDLSNLELIPYNPEGNFN